MMYRNLLFAAILAGASMGAVQAARADGDDWNRGGPSISFGFGVGGPGYYAPPAYYASPPPVYYAPPPRAYYAPPPGYYAPAPGYYRGYRHDDDDRGDDD